MKRPLFVVGCVYLAAAAAISLSGGRLAPALWTVGLATAISFWAGRLRPFFAALAAGAAGAALVFALHTALVRAPLEALAGSTLPFSGVVTQAQSLRQGQTETLCQVTGTFDGVAGLPPAVTLSVLVPGELFPGQGVTGRLSLSLPPQERCLSALAQGIVLSGKGELTPAATAAASSLTGRMARLRAALAQSLARAVPAPESGLVAGLVLSETGSLELQTLSAMRRSGTAHLLVVSGYHGAILSALVILLLRGLGAGPRLVALGAAAVVWLLVALVGFTPSMVRCAVMITLAQAAPLAGRQADSLTSLAAAALVVTLPNPYALFSWSFLLSFGACLSILLFAPAFHRLLVSRWKTRRKPIPRLAGAAASALSVTMGASVLTFPLQAVLFGHLPLFSLPANLLLAPLVPVMLVCGALAALLGLGGLWGPALALGIPAALAARAAGAISHFFAGLPGSSLPVTGWWLVAWLFFAALVAILQVAGAVPRHRVRWVVLALVPALLLGAAQEQELRSTADQITVWDDTGSFSVTTGGRGLVFLDSPRSSIDVSALSRSLELDRVSRLDLLLCQPLTPMKYAALTLGRTGPLATALPTALWEDTVPYAPASTVLWPLEGTAITALGRVKLRYDSVGRVLLLEIGDLKVLKLPAGYDIMLEEALTQGVGLVITPTGELIPLDPALHVRQDPGGRRVVWIS